MRRERGEISGLCHHISEGNCPSIAVRLSKLMACDSNVSRTPRTGFVRRSHSAHWSEVSRPQARHYLVPVGSKMLGIQEAVRPKFTIYQPGFSGDRRPSMAKAPAGKSSSASKSSAGSSSDNSSPGSVARQAKSGVKGNGNHVAQAELDLLAELPEEEEEAAPAEPAEVPSAQPAAAPAAAPMAIAAVAAPTMRELGLSGKGMWKVDLNGKRVNLDEKAWREELARALGRAPDKS